MTETIEESRCLASLAVFRELYDSEKDVYGIISEFLVEIIISRAQHTFNLAKITNMLNKTYDFSIPEAVVGTSLKRIKSLTKSEGVYTLENLSKLKSKKINLKKEQIQNNNDEIIKSLFEFFKSHKDIELTEEEKTDIVRSFISFIMDGTNMDDYSEFISAFIISKKDDVQFKDQLSTIKEGVVLYSGIRYNTNLNEIGSWKTDLTIFMETEMLFHFAGFNGEVYNRLWNDFFNYVKEINKKHSNGIKLRYFREVKDEIERFFEKAEYIVGGKDKANPKITAMMSIIGGCISKADVVSKKAKFYSQLKLAGIKEDDYTDYFDERYRKYNIVDQNVLQNLSKDLDIKSPLPYLSFLNFVNIHRKNENENNFDNIEYILLSGNSTTLKIAWSKHIKDSSQVPLATTLDFLTNKFWFKLNKGFGQDNFPLTFDIITRAQIVLSNQINKSVGKKFEELQIQYKSGKINKEEVKDCIVELRKQAKKPEEVLDYNVEAVLGGIPEESIEVFLKEQEHFKNKAIQQSEENTKLKGVLSQKEEEVNSHIEKEIELNSELIKTKKSLRKEKEKSIDSLEKQKSPIDKEVEYEIRKFKVIFFISLISAFIGIHYLILVFGWNDFEQWTWIIFYSIPLFISFVCMLFAEKTVNPIQLLKHKKDRIKEKKYKKFNFNISRLEELSNERDVLINEIEKLNSQHTTMAKKS